MGRVGWILTVVLLLAASSAWGRTLRIATDGSGDYTALQPAFDASQNGDTILIAPGTYGSSYSENYALLNRSDVVVSGTAYYGPTQTLARGKLQLIGCSNCEVWSLNLGWGIDIRGGADNEIRRCCFTGTAPASVDTVSRNLSFIDCAFLGSSNPSQLLLMAGTGRIVGSIFATGNSYHCLEARTPGTGPWQIINSAFAAGGDLFPYSATREFPLEMRNNIIYGVTTYGYLWPSIEWSYNASNLFLPGAGNVLLTQSPFVHWSGSLFTSDLHLSPASPCWDAGDPVIRDREARGHDENRSDIGCFGGLLPFYPEGYSPLPAPNAQVTLSVSPIVTVGDELLIRSSAQVIPNY